MVEGKLSKKTYPTRMEPTTEVIYAVGAVTVSILGALRFSRSCRELD